MAAAVILFKLRESIADDTVIVTGVMAAILVFMLGADAVPRDRSVAAAAGITAALLAAREVLHRLMRRLTWIELRAAMVLLVMSFVILSLIPPTPIGPFGGLDLAEVWTLAILMAGVSHVGYVASKLIGPKRGLLVTGTLRGLASSTAVTVPMARRSVEEEKPATALAPGTMAASAVAWSGSPPPRSH